MRDAILKQALKNALEHGKADPKAVIGRVLASEPALRANGKEVAAEAAKIVAEINAWSDDKKRGELLRLWPEALDKKKEEKREGLRPLPNVNGPVVMRFAPNPNGPPTLGSSRGIVINSQYCKQYNGRFICRFDDTDPSLKKPMLEAYDWYLQDMEWLGCAPDKVIYASDHVAEYYKVIEQLLAMRHAYVCTCPAEEFRKLKAKGKECPCRHQTNADALAMWGKMLAGGYKEGEAAVRIKTDMQHPDPAIRDWVAFRVRYGDHPRAGHKYNVWPMLDFESAIQDHMQAVTHIVRGKDLRDCTERQKYVYNYLGWTYPETLYWGRVAVLEFGKLSTSGILKGIEEGKYTGWDDPRLPTIRAMRRRGFDAQAITRFWIELGLSEKDVKVSMGTIEAFNRSLIDAKVKRFYFVPKPKKITVKGIPDTKVVLDYHPKEALGSREYFFRGEQVFYVPEKPEFFRLKGAFNVRKKGKYYEYAGAELVDGPKLQWVSDAVDAELVTPKNKVVKGVVERYALMDAKKHHEVQLERVGYARVDEMAPEKVVFWLTHE